jgi:hypothetical protein
MVEEPVATDHGEADRKGDEVVGLVSEFAPQVRGASQVRRYIELKDQQRDRDREDAIGESPYA